MEPVLQGKYSITHLLKALEHLYNTNQQNGWKKVRGVQGKQNAAVTEWLECMPHNHNVPD